MMTEFIGNVPKELIAKFKKAFPDDLDLIEYVEKGDVEGVQIVKDDIDGAGDRVLTPSQIEAFGAWENLCHTVFFEK